MGGKRNLTSALLVRVGLAAASLIVLVALLFMGSAQSVARAEEPAAKVDPVTLAAAEDHASVAVSDAAWGRLVELQRESLRVAPHTATSSTGPWTPSQTVTDSVATTATSATQTPPAQTPPAQGPNPDATCLLCHSDHDGSITFASGEEMSVDVDPAVLSASVHGSSNPAPVYCTDCHTPKQHYQYPHQPTEAASIHEFEADIAQNCENCHTSAELHNPGHLQAPEGADIPNCVNCHGGHDVEPVEQAMADPVAFCQTCHAIDDMENEQVRRAHADVVANLGPGESCTTCHTDQPMSQSEQCAACHSRMTGTITLADGDEISLHVDPEHVANSVHGDRVIDGVAYPALDCTACHVQWGEAGFPHPELPAESHKELRLSVEQNCVKCHEGVANSFADGVHAHAIQEGNLNAASCADCHGSHDIQDPAVPRTRISDTCGTCHEEIYEKYKASVHGTALYEDDNPDVPVCTDCHGVHDMADPTQVEFRLSSPEMCGKCHADQELMAKYNISTHILDTYVTDFHGKTVTMFEHTSPHEATNKAVCYDCHGIHDIQPINEGSEEEIKARLLATCQKCHPDAGDNFPAAWMGHYEPSLQHYPLVYLTNLFYLLMIPAVIGMFVVLVGSDLFRRITDWFLARRKKRS